MADGMVGDLERLRASASERVQAASDAKALEGLRVALLGK